MVVKTTGEREWNLSHLQFVTHFSMVITIGYRFMVKW